MLHYKLVNLNFIVFLDQWSNSVSKGTFSQRLPLPTTCCNPLTSFVVAMGYDGSIFGQINTMPCHSMRRPNTI